MRTTNEMRARCALLRERFAAIGGVLECGQVAKALGVHCAGNPETWEAKKRRPSRVRYVVLPKPTGRGFVSLGPMVAKEGAEPEWAKAADEHPAKPLGKRNRRKGGHALTEIGEKAQIVKKTKLARRYAWQVE